MPTPANSRSHVWSERLHAARQLLRREPSTTLATAHEGMLEANARGDAPLYLSALALYGCSLVFLGTPQTAVGALLEGLELSRGTDEPTRRIRFDLLNSLGHAHIELNDFQAALEHIQQALDVAVSLGDFHAQARVRGNLAGVWGSMRLFQRALESATAGRALMEGFGEMRGAMIATANIGNCELELGRNPNALGEVRSEHFKRAVSAYQTALQWGREQGDALLQMQCLEGLSDVYVLQGQPTEGLIAARAMLDSVSDFGAPFMGGVALRLIGQAEFALGECERAVETLRESLRILEQFAAAPLFVVAALQSFAEALATSGAYREAFSVLSRCYHLQNEVEFEQARRSALAIERRLSAPRPLSIREIDVLRLMADGRTNKEIGRELLLSPNTVRQHSVALFQKLGVETRQAAVARAKDFGLLFGDGR